MGWDGKLKTLAIAITAGSAVTVLEFVWVRQGAPASVPHPVPRHTAEDRCSSAVRIYERAWKRPDGIEIETLRENMEIACGSSQHLMWSSLPPAPRAKRVVLP